MAWTNIYMQLITQMGPVLGEGALQGFNGSIEIDDFKWGLKVRKADSSSEGFGGAAVASLKSLIALGGDANLVEMSSLTFSKRFDIASSTIHTCLDNHIPVISASITVLHIKPGSAAIHQPALTLVATDGYFASANLSLEPEGDGAEVRETITLNFRGIVVNYLKTVYVPDNSAVGKMVKVPTNPFVFVKPKL
jgi:type VI protein secretion system component Hcp